MALTIGPDPLASALANFPFTPEQRRESAAVSKFHQKFGYTPRWPSHYDPAKRADALEKAVESNDPSGFPDWKPGGPVIVD